MKKSKIMNLNPMILSIIITLMVLLYWGWLLYITQLATASNTYKHREIITDVKIQLASHRGNDKLYIFSNDNCFMLDTGWQNKEKSYDLAECILSDDNELTITVWDHLPRTFFDVYNGNFKVYQIADLRSDINVYWDISRHNYYQMNERIVGIIAGIVISIVAVVFNFLLYCGMNKKDRGRFA